MSKSTISRAQLCRLLNHRRVRMEGPHAFQCPQRIHRRREDELLSKRGFGAASTPLEALSGELNLKNWPSVSIILYDYLQKDSTSSSSDKRMAIEGALLRETVKQPNAYVRWIDGMQNIANVLTKANAEKDTLREFLRDVC